MSDSNDRKSTSIVNTAVAKQIIQDSKVFVNLSQDTIVVTEDRVKLILHDYLSKLDKKKSWIAPAGIFATIIITLITSEFQKFGFEPAVWKAIFVISLILCFGWLIKVIGNAFKSLSVDDIVIELKKKSKSKDHPLGTQLEVEEAHTLEIIHASYGTLMSGINVTEELNEKIINGRLDITANNLIAGDPDSGVAKSLQILYKYDGIEYESEYKEGETVSLPDQ